MTADLDAEPLVWTLDQVAGMLQVSRSTMDRIVASGALRVTRVGSGRGHPRVHPRDLDAYLAGRAGRPRGHARHAPRGAG